MLAQTCDGNSLSRRDSKFRIIASRVSPEGGPGGLKTHAHSEQPQPRKRDWSIHTSSRGIASIKAQRRSRYQRPGAIHLQQRITPFSAVKNSSVFLERLPCPLWEIPKMRSILTSLNFAQRLSYLWPYSCHDGCRLIQLAALYQSENCG